MSIELQIVTIYFCVLFILAVLVEFSIPEEDQHLLLWISLCMWPVVIVAVSIIAPFLLVILAGRSWGNLLREKRRRKTCSDS